jgi:carboxymethylenebutenolidase
VIVIMEAFGLNDHIEDVTRRFAAAGYHAVAPDLFHRGGEPGISRIAAYDDFPAVMKLFDGVTIDTVTTDLDATLAALAADGYAPRSTAITGFCWGGWVTFLAAVRHELGAAVTWYGGGLVEQGRLAFPPLVDEAAALRTPWLGQFGELDQGIPGEQLDRLQAALDAGTDVEHEIVRYADAHHGFHCDGRPAVFNADAAAASWQRCLAWLDAHLA